MHKSHSKIPCLYTIVHKIFFCAIKFVLAESRLWYSLVEQRLIHRAERTTVQFLGVTAGSRIL